MSAFSYILYSEKTGRYYVGSTDDLESRLQHHNAGSTPSTKAGAPFWKLKYSEQYPTRSQARIREYAIKRKKSRKYIVWLIEGKQWSAPTNVGEVTGFPKFFGSILHQRGVGC